MERIVREAEDFISGFTKHDLIYNDAVTIGRSIDWNEWVAVATWGSADDLGENDEPEEWPVRLRVHDADGSEAAIYLTTAEAKQLARALWDAVRKARTFPQPIAS